MASPGSLSRCLKETINMQGVFNRNPPRRNKTKDIKNSSDIWWLATYSKWLSGVFKTGQQSWCRSWRRYSDSNPYQWKQKTKKMTAKTMEFMPRPAITHRVYVTLVRFSHQTSVVFGYSTFRNKNNMWLGLRKDLWQLVKFRHKDNRL